MARRPAAHGTHVRHAEGAASTAWEARLEVLIAITLGLAAIVTAGAVYLNEHQEHGAELDFHAATHLATVLAETPAALAARRRLQD